MPYFKEYANQVMESLGDELGREIILRSVSDEQDEMTTYIAVAKDNMWSGVTTYSTIGLLTINTGYVYEGKPVVSELIGFVHSDYEEYSNVLGSIAVNTKRFGIPSIEGSVHKDVIGQYYPSSEIKHVVLTDNVLWKGLDMLDVGDKIITWLTPIPLSDSELIYYYKHGWPALHTVFMEHEIDIADICRKSVL